MIQNKTIVRLTLFVTSSLAGVTGVRLGAALLVVASGGRGEKLKLGKAEVLMGRDIAGRSSTSAT